MNFQIYFELNQPKKKTKTTGKNLALCNWNLQMNANDENLNQFL